MRELLGQRRVVIAAAVGTVLAVALALFLLTPRTTGVEGDWSTRAPGGQVVAGRAVILGDNSSLDLRTGKTVTLGSVRGGTPYVADDRLIIASAGQLDSARLDASARWTWRAPAGTTVSPVAASAGSTIVLACPATGFCRLVGLDAAGRESWASEGEARREPLPAGPLPRVDATALGGGVRVADPASGRTTLQPGRSFVALPDGPVVTEVVQGGKCIVSAYRTADPAWTRVLPDCVPDSTPRLLPDPVHAALLTITWSSSTQHLDLDTGAPAPLAVVTPGKDAELVRVTKDLVVTESRRTLHTNPFRWGRPVTVLELARRGSGDLRARIVSEHELTLLHLDTSSVVVRDGDQVVRYTF